MKKSNTWAAFLRVSSFVGASFNAEHHYGIIKFCHNANLLNIEVLREISGKEAIYLNKKDGYKSRHRKGEMTDRMNSREEVIETGIKLFKSKYPDYLLFKGDVGTVSAMPLIYWPKKLDDLAEKVNELAVEWNKIDGYEGNPERAEKIDDDWFELVRDFIYKKP